MCIFQQLLKNYFDEDEGNELFSVIRKVGSAGTFGICQQNTSSLRIQLQEYLYPTPGCLHSASLLISLVELLKGKAHDSILLLHGRVEP